MSLPEMIVPEGTSRKAIKACHDAMVYLRSLGWPESSVPELEKLWWTLHDKEGKIS